MTSWNAIAGRVALGSCLAPTDNPLHESRLYGVMHIAIHDARNAIDRRSEPYAFWAPRLVPGADADAAVASAARQVLVELAGELPEPFASCVTDNGVAQTVEGAYTAALAPIADGNAKRQGVQLGEAAAQAILALRTGDGSDTELFDTGTTHGTAPGCTA